MNRRHKRLPLDPPEADALWLACRDERDKLIVAVLLETGIRVAEFCSLTPESILWQQDRLSVRGKGDKRRTVPLPLRARTQLATWFSSRDAIGLGTRAVELRVKAIAGRARIRKKVTPHVLRHTYSRDMLRRGISLRALQEALGHERLETTGLYLYMDAEDVMKDYREKGVL